MSKKKKKTRGGWRDGSGRPKKYSEPTKTISIRVPASLYDDLKENVSIFIASQIQKKREL